MGGREAGGTAREHTPPLSTSTAESLGARGSIEPSGVYRGRAVGQPPPPFEIRPIFFKAFMSYRPPLLKFDQFF